MPQTSLLHFHLSKIWIVTLIFPSSLQNEGHSSKVLVKERERYTLSNPVLFALTQVAGFALCLSIVRTHHHVNLLCQWHRPFVVRCDRYAPPLVSFTSYLVAHALFFSTLQNPTLFSKHHHYPFSKHAHIIVLHSPWLVHPRYFLNPANL